MNDLFRFIVVPVWGSALVLAGCRLPPASPEAADAEGDTADRDDADLDGDSDGYSVSDGDCDDTDNDVHPGVVDVCGDGRDDDCSQDADGCVSVIDSLATADAAYHGDGTEDRAGFAVDSAGDVNGDGFDDLLVGAPGTGDGEDSFGAAYLVLGSTSPKSASLEASNAIYFGEEEWDHAGHSVAGVGDVDGDGFDDVLLGASAESYYGKNHTGAYLILGAPSPTSRVLSAADAEYTGDPSRGESEHRVSGAGDFDGDGLADMLVSACRGSTGGGAGHLLLGSADPTSFELSSSGATYSGLGEDPGDDTLSCAVSGAEDVDGDGFDDVLLADGGGWGGRGNAYLILGQPTPESIDLSAADAIYAQEYGVHAVSVAGDVNGDGFGDLLVGVPYFNVASASDQQGAAYLILGEASPEGRNLADADAEYTGAESDDFGFAVSNAGDVDGDGFADVLVGAPARDGWGVWYDRGAAFLILGSELPFSAEFHSANAEYNGEADRDNAGISIASGGDFDGNGFADVVVGAPNVGDESWAGAAYLILAPGH